MKGQVYLLTSIETGMGYVGSTINLEKRLRLHKDEKYNNCRSKLLGRFTCLILEEVIDDDVADEDEFLIKLEWVERKWQDFYKGNLVNKKRTQVTQEENKEYDAKWREENPEYHKEYNAKYRAEHSEQIKEYDAVYRAEHSEQIKEYKKRYRAEHPETFKEYYATHSEKLKEKFDCECGGKFTHTHKSRHFKTKKHQEYIKSLSPL